MGLFLRTLVSCPRGSLYNSSVIPFENLPFPSLSKRGENRTEKILPLKKRDKGGFEFDFSCCHRYSKNPSLTEVLCAI